MIEDYKRDCQILQERLKCPNCNSIWNCTCTLEEKRKAKQQLINKVIANWHRRLRQYEKGIV